jgi:hypothetical protein
MKRTFLIVITLILIISSGCTESREPAGLVGKEEQTPEVLQETRTDIGISS